MSIFDKLKNLNRLKDPALLELIKDQRLKELLTRREFRITEEYAHRELVARAEDDEVKNLSLKFRDGFGELSGEVKKRFIPFTIPFSARFALEGVEFSRGEQTVRLRVDRIKPLDLDWVTARVVERTGFLSYRDGVVSCDLAKVPRLAPYFEYRLKGVQLADFLAIRELSLREGELVGRLGLCL
ncbi:MAG: hypothetical protein NDI77_12355, partial [Geobacteraceae bacterium]|nr:hypothetical protein [Geobacteraceae bacterium]